jgi:hypothetical protein
MILNYYLAKSLDANKYFIITFDQIKDLRFCV